MKLFLSLCMSVVLLISCSRFYLVTKNAPLDVALRQKRDWQFLDTNYHLVAHLDDKLVELRHVQYEPTTKTLSGTICEFKGKALYYYDLVMAAPNSRAIRKISDSYKFTQQVHFHYLQDATLTDTLISFSLDQVNHVDFVELNRKANAGASATLAVPIVLAALYGAFFLLLLNGSNV